VPKMKKYALNKRTYGKYKAIYYQGFRSRPKFLKDDGRGFKGCKHILETLEKKFRKFRFVLTSKRASAIIKRGKTRDVFLKYDDFKRLQSAQFSKNRQVQFEIINEQFPQIYPKAFRDDDKHYSYEPGILSGILNDNLRPAALEKKDLNALAEYYPKIMSLDYTLKAEVEKIYKNKQNLQSMYLNKMIANYEKRLKRKLSESDWQKYFGKNLMFFQENYVKKIEKQNIDLELRIPDFCVVTTDEYLDVLEIKMPSTKLLAWDKSHKNFYWSPEIVRAISQVEHYIDSIEKNSSKLKELIQKKYGVFVRVVRPRGIIVAGLSNELVRNKSEEDFRLLNQGLKNMTVIPYDDLTKRLKNIINSMKDLAKTRKRRKRK